MVFRECALRGPGAEDWAQPLPLARGQTHEMLHDGIERRS